MNKKIALIVVVVIVIAGLVYYRETITGYLSKEAEYVSVTENIDVTAFRKISAVTMFDVPEGGDHRAEFSIFVDADGVVQNVRAIELDGESKVYFDKFSDGAYEVIKGKKLSEVGPIDRVGTSSLTTNAFNSVLNDLKAQL
ncbi:MAG: hypothetical protein OQJ98_01425 [Candidatus Pacebacteria bacterium]|nr:hypothetical protein [Candidatus Paceibacterota bacterium]